MIREGVFVDLLEVVRNAVQIGAESYSLKEVERLTGYERRHDITKGSGAVVEYDGFMQRTAPGERAGADGASDDTLGRIAAYNEDDVAATMAVRDWLVDVRPAGVPWRPARLDDVPPDEEVGATVLALREFGGDADLLLADLLGFWGREGRAHNAQLRARAEAPEEHLVEDEGAIGGLYGARGGRRAHPEDGQGGQAPGPRAALPAPARVLRVARPCPSTRTAAPPTGTSTSSTSRRGPRRPRCSRRTRASGARCPPGSRSSSGSTRASSGACWPSSPRPPSTPAGSRSSTTPGAQLLARAPTRFVAGGGPADGRFGNDLDDMAAWVADLDRSWLAMQGPPGTGKTYRGARVIRELVRRGRRVGITAMSHAAIHNLVAATHEAFAESDELDLLACVVKPGSDVPDELDGVTYETDGKKCAGEDFNVVAGTTWLFASSGMRDNPVDVLVVDEAGQLALIDVVAGGVSAHNLLLLGDPQQLPQVNLAVHPGGSGASALEHVLDGRKTLPPEDGIFLDETRRMHPDVCDFIGEQFYEDRLTSHTSCVGQSTHLGTGVRWLRADHTGCSTRSPQEVDLVVDEIRRVLGGAWTDQHGQERPLTQADVLVVTPYNDQKQAMRDGLAAAGPRRRAGRDGRQVPGPGGPGGVLQRGHLLGRGRAPRPGLRVLPQPLQRGDQPRPLPGLPGLDAGRPRRHGPHRRRDADPVERLRLRRRGSRRVTRRVRSSGRGQMPMRRGRRLTGDTVQAINPFLVLGIDEAASREEIDAAYRVRVKECHPDRHASGVRRGAGCGVRADGRDHHRPPAADRPGLRGEAQGPLRPRACRRSPRRPGTQA